MRNYCHLDSFFSAYLSLSTDVYHSKFWTRDICRQHKSSFKIIQYKNQGRRHRQCRAYSGDQNNVEWLSSAFFSFWFKIIALHEIHLSYVMTPPDDIQNYLPTSCFVGHPVSVYYSLYNPLTDLPQLFLGKSVDPLKC